MDMLKFIILELLKLKEKKAGLDAIQKQKKM